jgi:hypothetical protein
MLASFCFGSPLLQVCRPVPLHRRRMRRHAAGSGGHLERFELRDFTAESVLVPTASQLKCRCPRLLRIFHVTRFKRDVLSPQCVRARITQQQQRAFMQEFTFFLFHWTTCAIVGLWFCPSIFSCSYFEA